MPTQRRRTVVFASVAACAAALAPSAFAQEKYPSKPVTIVVPQAPGGANDAIARIVAAKLTEQTGQQFIVDNKPGAGGNIGMAGVAKARP
ncbi:MAG: tripartite tricarboxylate transporter substrate-binding protein, partial [Rubrivivax sp.]